MKQNQQVREWGAADQVFEHFGITRGTLHKLAGARLIKSALIKTHANARKGVRLFNFQSIREFLEVSAISSIRETSTTNLEF
jgi:hypothetical protein